MERRGEVKKEDRRNQRSMEPLGKKMKGGGKTREERREGNRLKRRRREEETQGEC